jgi:hypothetical protein
MPILSIAGTPVNSGGWCIAKSVGPCPYRHPEALAQSRPVVVIAGHDKNRGVETLDQRTSLLVFRVRAVWAMSPVTRTTAGEPASSSDTVEIAASSAAT